MNVSEDHRPAVITFDLLYTDHKDLEGDLAFAEAAGKYGNVIIGINSTIEDGTGNQHKKDVIHLPYRELNDNASLGYTNCNSGKYSLSLIHI